MSNETSNTVIALLAGAVVGAGLGVLFAPDKGSETRRKIKEKLKDGTEDFSEKMDEIIGSIKEKVTDIEKNFGSSLDDLVANGKGKTEEMIEVLEAKLALLKKEINQK